jgi:hypothetical protein
VCLSSLYKFGTYCPNLQSINIVECREFRDLLLLLRDGLKESDIPHRTKIREAIIKAWQAYFQSLKADLQVRVRSVSRCHSHILWLQASIGKISFTSDLWSDRQRRSYMCITAHWIARSKRSHGLELKTALIAFHHVSGTHDGLNLAKTILNLLDRAGITSKVSFHVLIWILSLTCHQDGSLYSG